MDDGVVLSYQYSEDGDLISATDKYGGRKEVAYDDKGWIEKVEEFPDSQEEASSSTEYKASWNGRLDIIFRPSNTSRTLVHDKTGNVVSIATNDKPSEVTVELPSGRQRWLGDQVSETVKHLYLNAQCL